MDERLLRQALQLALGPEVWGLIWIEEQDFTQLNSHHPAYRPLDDLFNGLIGQTLLQEKTSRKETAPYLMGTTLFSHPFLLLFLQQGNPHLKKQVLDFFQLLNSQRASEKEGEGEGESKKKILFLNRAKNLEKFSWPQEKYPEWDWEELKF